MKAFYETFFPELEYEDGVLLHPGDQFCINPDGSAEIKRGDGTSQEFYPEDGWVTIKIDV